MDRFIPRATKMELSIDIKLSAVICLITITCSFEFCNATKRNESIIIIALPQGDNENVTSWEKSAEILPGAYVAIENINSDSGILSSTKLKLVTASSSLVLSKYEPYSGNVLKVVANLTWQNKSIIGIAGLLHPNTLLALQAFQLPIASLVRFCNPPESGVLSLTASMSVLTDSVLAFLAIINQTRIGVISESIHSYYSTVSNNLLTKANISLYIHVSHNHHTCVCNIIKKIVNSNVHVIFLSVRPSIALSVLLEAYKRGIKWPNYAWILHSYRLEDLYKLTIHGKICNESNILEGVLMFQLTQEDRKLDSNANSTQTTNPVAFLLHDAIWALALAAENRSFSENITFMNDQVYIYQGANNNSADFVGVYSGVSNVLINATIGTFVYDGPTLQRVVLSPYLMLISVTCLLFNTLLMILYIYFRNHPDVKSTNVSLSLLIFIGCYFLIGYTIVEFIGYAFYTVDMCMGSIWLSGLGLSLPVIGATVLVKMLRVYHIFTLRRRLKPNMYAIYIAPVIYTLLILLPCATVLTLWTIIDPLYTVNTYIEHPGFIMLVIACKGTRQTLWHVLIICYQISLSLAVVFIAIKTRKLRLARFKDTKKVNVFIYFTYFASHTCFAYWLSLYAIDHHGSSRAYVLIAGHIILALIAQFTLLVPKVWPPLVEKVNDFLKRITHTS